MFHWFSARAEKKSRKSVVAFQPLGNPIKMGRSYDQLAQEGYQSNVIVYRCVNLIAKNVAMPAWILYAHGHELDQHSLMDLIQRPNPLQSKNAFFEALMSHVLLSGNGYVEAVGTEGQPQELHLLRPDQVSIVPGEQGIPKAYIHQINQKKRMIPVDPVTGACSVLHLKLFNPLNHWYGLSPMESAATAIDQHNAVGEHNLALLQNGGRPSGALMVKASEGRPGGALTELQRTHLKQELTALYEGTSNAGRTMVLEGDLEWKEMGLSPKDLDFVSGKNLSAREIAQAYGVPSMLVGVPGDATYANYKEARFHLWEDTILPLLTRLMGEMNHWLTPQFGSGLRFTYDADSISALSVRRESLWRWVQNADFLTINEKREALGYSPIKNGGEISSPS